MAEKDKPKKDHKQAGNMFNWTAKKLRQTAAQVTPAKLAPKGTLSGAAQSIKEQVTGQKVDVPDTSSPVMESKCKELDQSAAFMEALLKGMRKQQKALKAYMDTSEDVTNALIAYARSSFVSDDLSQVLDYCAKWENFHRAILSDLFSHSTKTQEAMNDYIINGIPPARQEKKKFEVARRVLNDANLKAARAERDGIPPIKMKEITQEKEMKETQYLQAGEKAYAKIIDTVETTKYTNIMQLYDLFFGYHTFFKQGWDHAQREFQKFEEAKNKAQQDQSLFKMASMTRAKGLWAPESIGGDTKRVFAMNYQIVIERDKPDDGILPFLDQCFIYLEEKGLTTTGLFRVSAPKPQLDALKEKIDKGVDVDIDGQDEVHVVSGLIKLFLRELPAPLLTFELYPQWMSVVEEQTTPAKIAKIKEVVAQLPECNRILLARLMKLCTKILQFQDENKMTVENLAIVLCPSILYDNSPDPLTMVQDIQKANTVMVLLVLHYNELFGDGTPASPPGSLGPPPPSAPPPSLPALPASPQKGPPPTSKPPTLPPPAGPPPRTVPPGSTVQSTSTTTSTTSPPTSTTTTTTTTSTPTTTTTTISTSSVTAQAPTKPKQSESEISHSMEVESEEKRVEIKDGNRTIIKPENTAIPLDKLLPMVQGMESTASYYKQLFELFDGSYMFTRAAYNLKDFSSEEINLLNNAFQVVGKAIKHMLSFIKDYTTVFPGEVGKRILSAANRVRPHVKSLISYIKSFAGGQKLPVGSLIQATREFLIGTYQMYLVCYTASQVDELSQSGHAVVSLVKHLENILTTGPTQTNISVGVNNLQNHTLKFTSLLRSRLPDVLDSNLQQNLSVIVETAEVTIGEIFDEARNMLVKNALEMTPVFEEKTAQLAGLVSEVLVQRPALDQAVAEATIGNMTESTWEQLDSITTLHQEDDNPRVKELVKYLLQLSLEVRALGTLYNHAPERPSEWLVTCERVNAQFDHILQLVDQVLSEVNDESLAETLKAYTETTNHFLVQFKICAAATAFGVVISGYESSSFIIPLKDFAFVTYPFMYNFRDACTADEEETQ